MTKFDWLKEYSGLHAGTRPSDTRPLNDEEILELMDIKVIEKFLRNKKLKKLQNERRKI